MLATVQPAVSSRSRGLLGTGAVVELAICVVVQNQDAQEGPVCVLGEVEHGDVTVGVPAANIGRRPVRLQMRTGFSGPTSR
jgi:hypothetical protein